MEALINHIVNFIKEINSIIFYLGDYIGISTGLILLLSGILFLFWGYKLKKISLILIGFIFGAAFGIIISELTGIDNPVVFIAIIISLGIIFGLFNFFLYFVAVIVIGIITGSILGGFMGYLFNTDTTVTIVLCLIFAILGGILSVKINKITFIIITSFIGYLIFRTGLYSINMFNTNRTLEEIISIIVLISGLSFQFIDNFNINLSHNESKDE